MDHIMRKASRRWNISLFYESNIHMCREVDVFIRADVVARADWSRDTIEIGCDTSVDTRIDRD